MRQHRRQYKTLDRRGEYEKQFCDFRTLDEIIAARTALGESAQPHRDPIEWQGSFGIENLPLQEVSVTN